MSYQSYQRPPYPPYQTPLPNATAVLVLGILGIPGCLCYGLPGLVLSGIALFLAQKDLRLYNENPDAYTPGSVSNLRTGRLCAIAALSISLAWIVFLIVIVLASGVAALSDPTHFFHR